MPEGAIYVGRPTVWGNPYRVIRQGKTTWEVYAFEGSSPMASFVSRTGVEARAFAVERLLCLIDNHRDPWGVDRIRNELAGSDLACWCPLDQPCHADVLLEIANRQYTPQFLANVFAAARERAAHAAEQDTTL